MVKRLLKLWLACAGLVVGGALVAKTRLPVRDDPDGDEIALVSIFDGTELRSTASAFRGGTVVSVFGGTDLDLRRATVSGHGAHLEVTTVYGGTNITVPDTWLVTVAGSAFAGELDVTVPEPADVDADAPRVTVATRMVFGGTRIVARPVLKPAEETSG